MNMELPKLYRKVWVEWEWITDECWGGEHVQHTGFEYFQAYRTKKSDNTWYWKLVSESEKPAMWEAHEDSDYVCENIIAKPPWSNWFCPYNVPSIKEQTMQKDDAEMYDKLPF